MSYRDLQGSCAVYTLHCRCREGGGGGAVLDKMVESIRSKVQSYYPGTLLFKMGKQHENERDRYRVTGHYELTKSTLCEIASIKCQAIHKSFTYIAYNNAAIQKY